MSNKNEILEKLKKAMHPAISLNLVDLGIVSDVIVKDDKIIIEMAFPALVIPIKDLLLSLVREQLVFLKKKIDFEIREMTEEEKANFFNLEHANWRGM